MVRFYVNHEEVESIRFPITEVGETNTITMTIKNDSEEDIELIPFIEDRDVSLSRYPKRMRAQETAFAVWHFSPSKDRLKSLHADCGFREIIG